MSDGFSDRDKHEPVAGNDDQEAYLDSLIEQFEDDAELELPDDAALPSDAHLSAVDAEVDEIIDQLAASRDEPAAQNNSLNFVLAGLLAAGVIAMLLWPSSDHDKEKQVASVVAQPSSELISESSAVSVDNEPETVPIDNMDSEIEPEQAALSEEGEAEPIQNSEADHQPQLEEVAEAGESVMNEPEADSSVSIAGAQDALQELRIDPVSRKVLTTRSEGAVKAWAVNLTSVSRLALAKNIQQQLHARGTTTELIRITIGEQHFYRIRIAGFGSREEAKQARLPFLTEPQFADAWVAIYHEDQPSSE